MRGFRQNELNQPSDPSRVTRPQVGYKPYVAIKCGVIIRIASQQAVSEIFGVLPDGHFFIPHPRPAHHGRGRWRPSRGFASCER